MLGLGRGSLEAFLVDRDLAQLLADQEPTVDEAEPRVVAAAPSDPFARVPDELRGMIDG